MSHLQLYSLGAVEILKQALQSNQTSSLQPAADVIGIRGRRYSLDPPNENDDGCEIREKTDGEKQQVEIMDVPTSAYGSMSPTNRASKDLLNQMGSPPTSQIVINTDEKSDGDERTIVTTLQVPTVILPSPSESENSHHRKTSYPLLYLSTLSSKLSKENHYTLVILLQSGRLAVALFSRNICMKHRTSQRYTVRKGQGGSQSSNDQSKGKAKSVGSQLRRAGEIQLRQDMLDILQQWKCLIEQGMSLCFVSISKMLMKGFWEDVAKVFPNNVTNGNGNSGDDFALKKDNVKHIPLDIGKPSYDSCCAAYELMMKCTIQRISLQKPSDRTEEQQKETPKEESYQRKKNNGEQHLETQSLICTKTSELHQLTPLCQAARDADIKKLYSIINNTDEVYDIDARVGPNLMTALHFAAASTHSNIDASKCVYALLKALANPCLYDLHDRPPYYVAKHEMVRHAFRKARAELGEETWDWNKSQVASPLSENDIKSKKEKIAEKKRRQRQRQKEKKALEKMEAVEEEIRLKDEAEQQKQRPSLKANLVQENVCDYCRKICKGKRKSQMFSRLSFHYCSIDCVSKHKRELAAKAAEARFSSSS